MIKKIILAFFICCIMISCGKKGNPEYKDPEQKAKMKIILTDKA